MICAVIAAHCGFCFLGGRDIVYICELRKKNVLGSFAIFIIFSESKYKLNALLWSKFRHAIPLTIQFQTPLKFSTFLRQKNNENNNTETKTLSRVKV